MVVVDVRPMDKTQERNSHRVEIWPDTELGLPPTREGLPLTLYEVVRRMRHQNLEREADWLLDYVAKFWQEIG